MRSVLDQYAAAIYMSTGACLFGVTDIFVKLLVDDADQPAVFILLIRMVLTTLACLAFMYYRDFENVIAGPPEVRGLLVIGGVLRVVGVGAFYCSLRWLSLGEAVSLWYITPLVTGVLCSALLNEPFTMFEWTCGIIALIGVLLIAQPAFLFSTPASETIKYPHRMHGVFQIALSVLGDSFNKYLTRKIGDRAHSVQIVYYFAWVSAATLVLVSLLFSDARPNLDTWTWTCTIYTLTLAISGSIGTYCQIRAVQLAKAGRISLLFYIQMPLTMTLSYVVFGDALNMLGWTGSLVIVGTSLAVAFTKDESSHAEHQDDSKNLEVDQEETIAMMDEPRSAQPLLAAQANRN